jgi:flagellum-specific peptidoglycan hydrolase FlgJ
MSLTPGQLDALVDIARAAVVSERVTGCPAELSAAQCILESDWLRRSPGNNCFGIKSTDGNGQYLLTKEFIDGSWRREIDAFRVYDSLADCFIDHARLLTDGKPYADAWEHYREDPGHDLDTLIGAVARRYATDPAYAQEIMTLAHGPHVTASIAAARLG